MLYYIRYIRNVSQSWLDIECYYTKFLLCIIRNFNWQEKIKTNNTIRRNSKTDSAPRCFLLQFPPWRSRWTVSRRENGAYLSNFRVNPGRRFLERRFPVFIFSSFLCFVSSINRDSRLVPRRPHQETKTSYAITVSRLQCVRTLSLIRATRNWRGEGGRVKGGLERIIKSEQTTTKTAALRRSRFK